MDLFEEFKTLVGRFNAEGTPYAVCGGLAVAMHGHARATQDIDLLIPEDALERVKAIALEAGFKGISGWIPLAGGSTRLFRLWKSDPERGDLIPLDLLVVSGPWEDAWHTRQQVETEIGKVWTVSRKGLKQMKRGRGNNQDLADIEKLEEDDHAD